MKIRQLTAALFWVFLVTTGSGAIAQSAFTKSFSPDTVGPGSTSMLTFTIDNSASGTPISDLAFTDTLPAGMTVADGSGSFTCPAGTLTAVQGAGTISLAGGTLGGGSSCTISVKVTAPGVGSHVNTTGDLTHSTGNFGTASDTLTVVATLPGFSAAFSNPSPGLNQTVTLTYTIDNSANASAIGNLDFTATMPSGIPIASPNNATTDCGNATFPTVVTVSGDSITLNSDGFAPTFPAVAAGANCTVSVDVVAAAVGTSTFFSGALLADFVSAGTSSATLDVAGPTAGSVFISKQFMNDPIGPGGTAQLKFTLINNNLVDATALTFSDDFNAMLTGASSTGTPPTDPCGTGSSVSLGGTLTLTGGVIPARNSCEFTVDVLVPGGVGSVGTHTNTTAALSGLLDGTPFTNPTPATDSLEVRAGSALGLTKEFVGGSVNAGNPVTLRFTITNPNTGAGLGATEIAFLDELTNGGGTGFLPSPVSVSPVSPTPPCGAGSSFTLVATSFGQGLELAGGNLGGAEASCTFEVIVDIPADLPGGTYTNTTGPMTATIGGTTEFTPGASGNLTVNGGLNIDFTKSFAGAVAPGGTIDMTITITTGADSIAAQSIAFTDDLSALIPAPTEVTAGAASVNTCGGTLSGPSTLTYSGGSLAAGSSCAITVPVTVPASATPGSYTNTIGDFSAEPVGGGTPIPVAARSADLVVAGLVFSKQFLSNPVIAGGSTTLRFTIQNQSPTDDATITFFTDNLAANLPGLAATGAPSLDTCGGTMSGTTFLTYIGGGVLQGATCTIEVPILVPGGAADGTYANVTSALVATVGATPVTIAPATANLTVQSAQLEITKSFATSPVTPGAAVALQFTITNANTAAAADISFTDNLAAMLTGATYTSGSTTCTGANETSTSGASTLAVDSISLAGNASCLFQVSVNVPGGATAGSYTNTSSNVTGTIGSLAVTGDPAIAQLDVSTVGSTFTKSFDAPVLPGGTATLSFTITNPNAGALTGLAFTDNLDDVISGLVATTLPAAPCGAGSNISGTGFLTFSGGEAAASGGSCSFDVVVSVPAGVAGGTYPNSTSQLTSSGLFSAGPATASLTVTPTADISVSKTDGVTSATPGSTVTYSIVAANAGPSPAPSVSLTDSFPGDLTCAFTSVATGGATGNTAAGAGDLTETLSMPVGSSATYTATCDIAAGATGTLSNTATVASSLTDPVSGNETATDSDTVLVPSADLSVTKTDGVTSVVAGQSLTYTIVAANAGPSDEPAATMTDTFPAGLTCAYTSVAAGGASGNTASGTGDLSDTLAMPAGSSATYTAICAVDEAATGTLSNTASIAASVTDPTPGNNAATDADTVIAPTADVSITKTDGLTSVIAGESLTYTIDVANAGPSTDPAVTVADVFPTDLTCTFTSTASGSATGNSASGAGDIADTLSMPSGSSVSYSAICAVDEAATGTLSNTATATASVTDPTPGNNTDTDADTVIAPSADLSITKDDGLTSVDAGTDLTYTITATNAGPSTDPAVSIADTFPTDLTTCNYTAVATGGASGFTASGSGDIADTVAMPSGATVTYTAICTVSTAANTTLSNTATIAASAGVTDPAPGNNSATDGNTTVSPTDLMFTKLFAPDSVEQGQTTELTFTINNDANAIAATGLAFSDDMAALGLVLTGAAPVSDCSGTLTAVSGTSLVTLSGGTTPAGTTCEITVTLRADTPGSHDNVTSGLTSNLPDQPPATDTIAVSASQTPTLSKTLSSTAVEEGQVISMTLALANPNGFLTATSVDLQDVMTGNLAVTGADAVGTAGCDGTVTGAIGAETVSFAGSVDPNTTCTITVDLVVLANADFTNTATVTTSLGDTSASVPVTVTAAVTPTLTKTLSATAVEEGEVITMTLDLVNPNAFLAATSVDLQDVMTGNLAVTLQDARGNIGCDGTVSGAIGAQTVSFTGTVAPATTCTISVDLLVLASADFTNTATMTTSLGDTSDSVAVTVTAAATPTLTKTLSSTSVDEGEAISMVLEITNPNAFRAAESVVLTDDMTGTLRVTTAATGSTGCDGPVAGATGSETVSFNGTVAAGTTCTINVGLLVIAAADFTNTATLTSNLGNASASVPVGVAAAPPLTFSMEFLPDSVEVSRASTLRYTIQNTALIKATSISILDTLPTNLIIARPVSKSKTCVGGMVGAVEGGGTISYDGGELEAGATCTVSVDVVSGVAATYPNSTETQTSSLGASAVASDTLTVVPATNGRISIVQYTDTDGDFVFSSAEPGLNFTITTTGGRGNRGPIELPVGSYSISQNPPTGVGTTAITCNDADSTGDPAARTITVNLSAQESVTCTLTSVGSLQKTVDTINRFLTKRADLILSSEPGNGRRFDRLNRGFGNASRFSWSPGDLKAFLPFSAQVSSGSGDYRFSTSMLQARQAAASVALAHGSTQDTLYVDNYRFDAWFEAQYKKFDSGAQGEGHFAIAYFGADYLLNNDVLVGVILQIDDMEDLSASLNTSARGTGWMIGPYMTARLAPNLYFDGRIAAGRSDNEVSPFNTYTDSFKTDRWLAMASLTGDFQRGAWNIKPTASLSYFEETQDAYIDGIGVTIPSQTVRLGQLKIGPTFSGKFETDDGMLLAPYFGIDAIYNIGNTTGVTITNPATPATEGWRGRLQAGLDMTTENGTRISFGGTYDGLFRDGFESWGLMFDLTIPLSKPTAR